MKKVLLISEFAPPQISGPATILKNIFTFFPSGSYAILMDDKSYGVVDENDRLPCKYFNYDIKTKGPKFSREVLRFFNIPLIILKGVKIIKIEKIDSILAFSHSGPFLIAAYYLSKIFRKPLFVYFLDYYQYLHLPDEKMRIFMAKIFEGRIIQSARKVFVMSETLKEIYDKRYGVNTCYLPHPVIIQEKPNAIKFKGKADRKICEVVYTGQVGTDQLDSILNMVQVVNSKEDLKFSLYVPRPSYYLEHLRSIGIKGPNVFISTVSRDEVKKIQRNADVLFLPIAFKSQRAREYIGAASPSKLPEYLLAGRPILVHAPDFAYVIKYARKSGWGVVVDRPDVGTLSSAIDMIRHGGPAVSATIVAAARTLRHHDSRFVAQNLMDYLFC